MRAYWLSELGNLGAVFQVAATKAGVPGMYINSLQRDASDLVLLLEQTRGGRWSSACQLPKVSGWI